MKEEAVKWLDELIAWLEKQPKMYRGQAWPCGTYDLGSKDITVNGVPILAEDLGIPWVKQKLSFNSPYHKYEAWFWYKRWRFHDFIN